MAANYAFLTSNSLSAGVFLAQVGDFLEICATKPNNSNDE